MTKKTLIIVLGIFGFVLAGILMARTDRHEPVVVREGRPLVAQPPAVIAEPVKTAELSKAAPVSVQNSAADIVELYRKVDNGRAFVLSAWNRPNEGGRFYASKLIDRCAGIKGMTDIIENPQLKADSIRPENQSQAAAAVNRIFALCGQFTDEELKKYSGVGVFADAKEGDVLIKLYRRILDARSSKDESEKSSAVKAAIDAADPLLIDDLGPRLLNDPKGGGIFLDGKTYKMQDAEEILAAYYLLPCGLGLDCSSKDPMMAVSCASGGGCYENRFEKAKAEMVGGDSGKYQRVLAIYESMVVAVKNKKSSFFTRP